MKVCESHLNLNMSNIKFRFLSPICNAYFYINNFIGIIKKYRIVPYKKKSYVIAVTCLKEDMCVFLNIIPIDNTLIW